MWNWIGKLEELRQSGRAAMLVTVTGFSGSTPREPGAKMIVLDDELHGTIGGGHLEDLATVEARALLAADGAAKSVRYPLGAKTGQCCGGVVELFFEPLNNGPRLYLFGAGHVGQAVARVMAGTPFRVHVVDERPEWIAQLPPEVARHEGEWDDFARDAQWNAGKTYVAIMTHRHDTDQDIVADVVKRDTRYIGLIGSESKWERFRQRLGARGFSESELARVKCPIGIDIGGKAPQEVAVSLAAELLRTHYAQN